jgi:toxin ParE1/3/4
VTRTHVYAKAAADDLREITRYTLEQWGAEQCRSYIAALDAKAAALAQGQGPFKDLSSLIPGLRAATSGKHYVFCLPRKDAPALILAILHERMDILVRLKSRLTD